MIQVSWTYKHIRTGTDNVVLMHGQESGHVVISCNGKIINIDFLVLEPKSYSFYLKDNFFEVAINKSAATFDYTLHVNRDFQEKS